MGPMKNASLWQLFGIFLCLDGAFALCANMEDTCLARASDVHNQHLNDSDGSFRHCEVLLAVVDCVEEYICTCNVTINEYLELTFQQTFDEYNVSCHNVQRHIPRTIDQLKCLGEDEIPPPIPTEPDTIHNPETGEAIFKAELEEMDRRLLQECDEYYRCSQVYNAAVLEASRMSNSQQQITSICQANRFNIVCMSDAFCSCQEGNNTKLKTFMDTIRVIHERNCQEQLNVAILQCSDASRVSVSTSGLLTLTLALTLTLIMQVLKG